MNNRRDVDRTQQIGDRTQQLGDRTQQLGDRTQQISPPTVATPSAPQPAPQMAWSDEQPAAPYGGGSEYVAYDQPQQDMYYGQEPQYGQHPQYGQPPSRSTTANRRWLRLGRRRPGTGSLAWCSVAPRQLRCLRSPP